MLRSISTKESFKGNNNDGMCLDLWIHMHWPHGVIPPRDDRFCVGRVMEASQSSASVSEWHSLHRVDSKEVLIGTLIAASCWRRSQGIP
jgi:hypothetical protein